MQLSDFDYALPPELVAQRPPAARRDARLLLLPAADGELAHGRIADLPGALRPGDLVVMNDTRVIPARLHGRKDSGGRVEILVERIRDDGRALAHLRASKSPRADTHIDIEPQGRVRVSGREGEYFVLERADAASFAELLECSGHVPLPPYIERSDDDADRERYQTVFARKPGAVAAPTAGLHIDEALLDTLHDAGIDTAFITLHVGAGTFQPVRGDDIDSHRMHSEQVEVTAPVCEAVARTHARGRRVVAIGTTVVRALEAAARNGLPLAPFRGDTALFIRPGFDFRVVDALLTNFHLPRSTLLMLVAAFGGYDRVMRAYQAAIDQRYRFFSYGDAMFLARAD